MFKPKFRTCITTSVLLLFAFSGLQADAASSTKARRDSLIQSATAFHASGRYLDAARTFLLAGADTGSAAERFGLGMVFASLNDFQRTLQYLHEAVRLDSENVNYRFQLARFLSQSGASQEGQSAYERVLQSDSTYLPALTALGQIYNQPETYERSVEMYRRALALNPDDYLSTYYLANVMISLVNPDSALMCLNTCLQLNPGFVPALNLTASIHYAKKRYEEAVTFYLKAANLRPANADLMNKVGLCYRNLEQFGPAAIAFLRASELDSLSSSYAGNLGHAYYRLSRYDSSVFAYKRAVALENENTTYYSNLALALQQLDSVQSAALAYRRAIQSCHPELILELKVKLGSLYYLGKDYRSAIEAYQVVLRTDPENRDAQFYLALSHDNLAEYSAASANYQKYIKLAESPPPEKERIAWARKRLEALEYLQSVKKK